jgi:hypothetical protein
MGINPPRAPDIPSRRKKSQYMGTILETVPQNLRTPLAEKAYPVGRWVSPACTVDT